MVRTMAALALVATALMTGAAQGKPQVPPGATYVALGSSYAAGPGIATPAPDSPGRCAQSAENYPRQLARALKLKLIDRSCGGATTADILGTGPLGNAPQIDGLTADTRLVTVTIGGNDLRYMADLAVAVCRAHPELIAEAARARCATPAGFDLEKSFGMVEANLKAIAAETRRRSPQARLVFVDYVTVLAPGATCGVTKLGQADTDAIRARADRLARLIAQAAKAAGADLVAASALSAKHDACAADPWIEGYVVRPGGGWGPVSFHPRLPAMTAIAKALEAKLGG